MVPVDIYTKPFCPYCHRALGLLQEKNAEINEIVAGFDAQKRDEMIKRAGGANTFPQIFIGDYHVGGCDELYILEAEGKLNTLLRGEAA